MAKRMRPAVESEIAVPATRWTTEVTDPTCPVACQVVPSSAMPTASEGEPSRSSPNPNIQVGVTMPIGPNRIHVPGRRSHATSDTPRIATITQSTGTAGLLTSVQTSTQVKTVASTARAPVSTVSRSVPTAREGGEVVDVIAHEVRRVLSTVGRAARTQEPVKWSGPSATVSGRSSLEGVRQRPWSCRAVRCAEPPT